STKLDALSEDDRLQRLRAAADQRRLPFFAVSAASGEGIPQLLEALWTHVAHEAVEASRAAAEPQTS
ncbi:MAG: GTPase ObgE, partial [Vicinamibacterales bacterium]